MIAVVLTIFLCTSPYAFQNTHSAMRLAEAALEKGHQVAIFASGDVVYSFVKDQRAKGVPNAQEGFEKLIRRGLTVEL